MLNGTWKNNSVSLGKLLNTKLEVGEVYKLSIKYIGGSYTSKDNPKMIFDFQIDEKNYSPRVYETTFINGVLPKSGTIERTITVTNDIAQRTTNFYYWLYQGTANGTTFNNYRVQVFVTKIDTKEVNYNEPYRKVKVSNNSEIATLEKQMGENFAKVWLP